MYVHSADRPIESDSPTLEWMVVLATEAGVRVADAIDRLNLVTPPSRTLTIIGADLDLLDLEGRSDHAFRPPSGHNTGLAILISLAMIKRWTPKAVVTITPIDHAYSIDQIRQTRAMAARLRDKVLVLADAQLGDALVEVPDVRTVIELSRTSPLIACGTAAALWELAGLAQPELVEMLDFLVPLLGMPDEFDAIDHVYRSCPPISFARDILERFPERLMAMGVERVRSEQVAAVVDRASAG